MNDLPNYTVLYNIVNSVEWVGTGWEFFSTKSEAQSRYKELIGQGNCPTLRPFHVGCDLPHMGGAEHYSLRIKYQDIITKFRSGTKKVES